MIKNSIDAAAFDLNYTFKNLQTDDLQKLLLLKKFGTYALCNGMGYATIPGENEFCKYISTEIIDGKEKLIVSDIPVLIPDFYKHKWFTMPEKTGKPYIQIPKIDKIFSADRYFN